MTMTLKDQLIELCGRLQETPDNEVEALLEDIQDNGTDHHGGAWVDHLAEAILEQALEL